jgi:hypothetical protein
MDVGFMELVWGLALDRKFIRRLVVWGLVVWRLELRRVVVWRMAL